MDEGVPYKMYALNYKYHPATSNNIKQIIAHQSVFGCTNAH